MDEAANPPIDPGQQNPVKQPAENNLMIEGLPLRQPSLTLSKFDETMPSTAFDSKNSMYRRTMRSSSVHYQSRIVSPAIRRGSYDERSTLPWQMRQSSVGQSPIGNTAAQIEGDDQKELKQDVKETEASPKHSLGLNTERTSSILQELATRQRYYMYVVVSVCGFIFVTGCALTVICFSISSTKLIPGQVIGVIMFVGGGVGCIAVVMILSQPDRELQKKIERREKMFSTFREIAYRNEVRRHSSSLNEKLVSNSDAFGDDREVAVT